MPLSNFAEFLSPFCKGIRDCRKIPTLLATISMNTRSRDLLLPIIFLPLIVPVLIAATGATTLIFAEGASFGSLLARVLFLLGFDAVFLVAAYGTYDFAIGE